MTNVGGLYFRAEPSKSAKKAASGISSGTSVWVYGSVDTSEGLWYSIRYSGKECYVLGDFLDELSPAAPAPGALTVRYVDTNGAELASHTQPLDPGAHTVSPTASIPEGYQLLDPASFDVSVDDAGAATPASVTFTYQAPAAPVIKGSVTLHYVDDQGKELAPAAPQELDPGKTQITPNFSTPEGYTLLEPTAYEVTVDDAGNTSPSSVTVTYQSPAAPEPVRGSVAVYYTDDKGNALADPQTVSLDPGNARITPAIAAPSGYTLLEPTAYDVTVDSAGAASPASVTFTYRAPVIANAVLYVNYVDTNGAAIIAAQRVELAPGTTTTVTPTASLPSGYTLVGDSSVQVTVDASGVANPASVTFTYQAPVAPEPIQGSVTVYYVDTTGLTVASPQTFQYAANGSYTVLPTATIPAGYTLTGNASVTVTVDAAGVASPASVTYTYQAPVAVQATVVINYTDTTGQAIVSPETRRFSPGSYIVEPNAAIPGGYTITGAGNYSVMVDAKGVATPSSVTFTYVKQDTGSYVGFALTTSRTALRSTTANTNSSVIATLETGTLLYINGQVNDANNTRWDGAITYIGEKKYGYVLDSAIQTITDVEAQAIINASESSASMGAGYYAAKVDGAPMRTVASVYSNTAAYLALNTVVYVSGQTANEGYTWHVATYGKYTGYVREDQLRRLTDAEVQQYLSTLNTTQPTVTNSPAPYDPYAASSYGYVTKSGVNFRQTPNGTRIKTLNQYAFALILGSRVENGVTWYNVNQSGATGWVHGDYFKVLNLTELSSFLNSGEYLQGLNSSTGSAGGSSSGGSSSGGSTGSATQGAISSVEDWNVGVWQSGNTGVNASYAPFDPYATPSATVSAAPTPSATPAETIVIGTMIPITYEDESLETQTDNSWVGFVIGAVVLLGGAGGVYAYALNQNKKRRAAARSAAANRAANASGSASASASGTAGAANPYARRAVAAPPYAAGTQRKEDRPSTPANPYARAAQNPYATGAQPGATGGAPSASGNPYARPTGAPTNPYAAPTSGASADPSAARANPYAQPTAVRTGGTAEPTAPANPYVRPSGTAETAPDATAAPVETTHRRAGRTARYQNDTDKKA